MRCANRKVQTTCKRLSKNSNYHAATIIFSPLGSFEQCNPLVLPACAPQMLLLAPLHQWWCLIFARWLARLINLISSWHCRHQKNMTSMHPERTRKMPTTHVKSIAKTTAMRPKPYWTFPTRRVDMKDYYCTSSSPPTIPRFLMAEFYPKVLLAVLKEMTPSEILLFLLKTKILRTSPIPICPLRHRKNHKLRPHLPICIVVRSPNHSIETPPSIKTYQV